MIYCLKGPDGKLIESTASSSAWTCWEKSFWIISDDVPGFRERYWKRLDASRRAASRIGYRIVKCDLVEMVK